MGLQVTLHLYFLIKDDSNIEAVSGLGQLTVYLNCPTVAWSTSDCDISVFVQRKYPLLWAGLMAGWLLLPCFLSPCISQSTVTLMPYTGGHLEVCHPSRFTNLLPHGWPGHICLSSCQGLFWDASSCVLWSVPFSSGSEASDSMIRKCTLRAAIRRQPRHNQSETPDLGTGQGQEKLLISN